MKTKTRTIVSIFIAFTLILSAVISFGAYAQKKSGKIKIGTYDSRTIIFAWSRTDLLKQYLVRLRQKSDSAEKVHDTARIKELSVGAMSFQHLLHLMIFSTGSVASFMKVIKDKLPQLAKTEDRKSVV